MSDVVRAVTEATFDEEVRASPVPVLVDVWADWCAPCKAMAPVLESIASEHGDRVRVVKVDGDEHPAIVRRFAVMSFPTLLVFRDGELVKRLVGARGRRHLLEELDEVLR